MQKQYPGTFGVSEIGLIMSSMDFENTILTTVGFFRGVRFPRETWVLRAVGTYWGGTYSFLE